MEVPNQGFLPSNRINHPSDFRITDNPRVGPSMTTSASYLVKLPASRLLARSGFPWLNFRIARKQETENALDKFRLARDSGAVSNSNQIPASIIASATCRQVEKASCSPR
jgi:hypothetical protein